jgi:hypothetical protein
VFRTRPCRAVFGAFIGVIVLVGSPRAQSADPRSTISEVSLPGGLRAALAAIGDEAAPDRAQFLVEFLRRTYDAPFGPRDDPREAALQSLLAELEAAAAPTGAAETLPLPLSASIWIRSVFGGRATPQTLVGAILRSRNAALFYVGLLSLDDDTRAWLAGQPDLIAELASRHPAAFLVVAPGLRMTPAGLRVPGGAVAEPVWRALVGRRPNEPAEFVRALVAADEGRVAYFFGEISQLTPPQVRVALNLQASDDATRVESARRLYSVFERMATTRTIEQRPFTRPVLDPALLVAELGTGDDGQPVVPGTRALWNAVFDESRPTSTREESRGPSEREEPTDFPWLCEQVFKGPPNEHRRRYMMVLFASRRLGRITRDTLRDDIDAVRAAGAYPALTTALERARVTDIATFASAARRATDLSTIDDDARAVIALAQFQGALAVVTRAASRGSLPRGAVSEIVSSLSAVPVSKHGDYEGRLVCWLRSRIQDDGRASQKPQSGAAGISPGSAEEVFESAAGPMERRALRLLAGPAASEPRFVEWEGTRYRVDLARAEAMRLTRALGDAPRPYLSSADAVVLIADAVSEAGLTREGLTQQAQALARAAPVNAAEGAEGSTGAPPDRYREVTVALQRAAGAGDVRAAARLAPALRLVADDLLARGLMELAYAAALGQRDGVSISAADAASRHEFGVHSGAGRTGPWRLPLPGTDARQRWRVGGSLLGLDVGLSDFALVRLSSKPPARRPTLGDADRRVFTEAVALVEPASLTDADRDTIVAALRNGRAKLGAARTPAEALAIADTVGLSAQRRTLLSWVIAYDPARLAVFLSPSELLSLGLEHARIDALQAWGAPAGSRLGCLCLQIVDRRPWESFAGRGGWGLTASAFPDLNLRLAELLTELHMSASLLAPVLSAATLDFINSVVIRDSDDRRSLVEFVQTLRSDRVEQYLALLTTDGPLVPLGEAPAARDVGSLGLGGVRPGGPR